VRRRAVRAQAAFLIASSGVSLLGNLLYVTALVPWNVTVPVLSLSGALLVVGMARAGLFGVAPAALAAIAADHPDGVVIVDDDRRVQYANVRAGELLAPLVLAPDAPVAESLCDERLRPELRGPRSASDSEPGERDASSLWQALLRPEGLLLRFEGDPPRYLHASASPVTGPGARSEGYRLRIADLTAQKQAELRERQVERLDRIAALARHVANDFQGAFAVIRANASLLAGSRRGGAASERQLTRISEAAEHGLELARELELCSGSVHALHVRLDLRAVARETCGVVESDLAAGVRLVGDTGADREAELPVEADAIQLRLAIYALLVNAAEAMADRGGEIAVTTGARRLDPARAEQLVHGRDEPLGDFAFVRVRDSGGGMDAHTADRAFEPFFSTRGKERGHGLSTVLGIVRAHDGLLDFDNRLGQGCTFTLYLPLCPDVELRASSGAERAAALASGAIATPADALRDRLR
jgi:signal transduction histidine kinase